MEWNKPANPSCGAARNKKAAGVSGGFFYFSGV
jgi:hypothetical protein